MPPEPTDAARIAFGALADLPATLARFESQQREILARLDVLAQASPPVLVDLAEVVRRGIAPSLATARRWASGGVLPARRVGKRWLVDLSALKPTTPDEIARLAREAAGQ
jgi:hypothetical protein